MSSKRKPQVEEQRTSKKRKEEEEEEKQEEDEEEEEKPLSHREKYEAALKQAVCLQSPEEDRLFDVFTNFDLCQYPDDEPEQEEVSSYLELLGDLDIAIETLDDWVALLFVRKSCRWGEVHEFSKKDEALRLSYVNRIKREFKTPLDFANHICQETKSAGQDTLCAILTNDGDNEGKAWLPSYAAADLHEASDAEDEQEEEPAEGATAV